MTSKANKTEIVKDINHAEVNEHRSNTEVINKQKPSMKLLAQEYKLTTLEELFALKQNNVGDKDIKVNVDDSKDIITNQDLKTIIGQKVQICGYLHSNRQTKNASFIILRHGIRSIQCVLRNNVNKDVLRNDINKDVLRNDINKDVLRNDINKDDKSLCGKDDKQYNNSVTRINKVPLESYVNIFGTVKTPLNKILTTSFPDHELHIDDFELIGMCYRNVLPLSIDDANNFDIGYSNSSPLEEIKVDPVKLTSVDPVIFPPNDFKVPLEPSSGHEDLITRKNSVDDKDSKNKGNKKSKSNRTDNRNTSDIKSKQVKISCESVCSRSKEDTSDIEISGSVDDVKVDGNIIDTKTSIISEKNENKINRNKVDRNKSDIKNVKVKKDKKCKNDIDGINRNDKDIKCNKDKNNGTAKSKSKMNAQAKSKVNVGLDTRLNNRAFDLRTPINYAVFNIQSAICTLFREYFLSKKFIEIHSPKIIGGASEGGSSVFNVDYFGQPAVLAQSPQFYKQMMIIAGRDGVFEVGSVSRAENTNTARHLCEFTGLDIEMVIPPGKDYRIIIEMVWNCLIYIFNGLKTRYSTEIEYVRKQYYFDDLLLPLTPDPDNGRADIIPCPVGEPLILDFKDGCRLLGENGIHQDPSTDLSTASERALGEIVKRMYGSDLFVLEKYPLNVRQFYTMPCSEDENVVGKVDDKDDGRKFNASSEDEKKDNIGNDDSKKNKIDDDKDIRDDKVESDNKSDENKSDEKNKDNIRYSNSYDFILRGQEICSGSQRINDYKMLLKRIAEKKLTTETMIDYVESFAHGCPNHGGAGLGLERILCYYLNLPNIRLASLFPRDPSRSRP